VGVRIGAKGGIRNPFTKSADRVREQRERSRSVRPKTKPEKP